MAGVRCGRFVAADPKDFLQEVLLVFAHLAAGIDWGRAVQERDVEAAIRAS